MPLPVIPDVFRCTLNWKTATVGKAAANVLHVHDTAGTLAPSQVMLKLASAVSANMWQNVFSGFSIDVVTILPLDGVSAGEQFATGGGAVWTGQSGGEYIPALSSLISLRTPVRGPQGRGRVYLPACTEGVQVNGIITAVFVTNAQTAWSNFIAAMQTASVPVCVASYSHTSQAHVVTAFAEAACATQRRRQDRVRG